MDVYKPRIWLLSRITALFFLLSLMLWTVVTFVLMCEPVANEYPLFGRVSLQGYVDAKGVATSKSDGIEDTVKWFISRLPSHSKDTLQSQCPPVNISSIETEFFVTLAVVGDLHLSLVDENTIEPHAATFVANISGFLKGADAVITNLASPVPNEGSGTVEILRSLRALGIKLVSLANSHIHLNGDKGTASTIHALEAADIRWLGLNSKQHEIVMTGGQKVGFLAFCGVYGECIESSSFPFAPLRYSAVTATGAVGELKEHGVTVIIVLMHWGRENSYYPDETMLTIARHLAQLGVTLIIGYHPSVVQDHAYFGRTLVVFSLGNLLSSNKVASYCWQQMLPGQWEYSSLVDQCKRVHPNLRQSLLHSEQQTRVYRIRISRAGDAVAEYVTVPLEVSPSGVRKPRLISEDTEWTTACGESDYHCLSCKQL